MNLVSMADFARLSNLSRAAVSKMVKSGKIPASENKKIDIDYPVVRKYLKERNAKVKKLKSNKNKEVQKKNNKKTIKKVNDSKSKNNDLKKILDDKKIYDPSFEIDIEEFKEKLGLSNLKLISDIRQKEADIRKKVLDQKIKREEYVDKNNFKIIFSYLDNLNKRILDFPVKVIDRIIALSEHKGNEARGEIIDIWTSEISKLIKNSKDQIKEFIKED